MIVVEPSLPALKHINILKDNIAGVLRLKGIGCSIKGDKPLLVVTVDGDEVDALYELTRIHGISTLGIAEESSKEFNLLLRKATDTFKGIIHKDESFRVEVIGGAKDYVSRDLEFALTASLVAELSDLNVRPSNRRADRVLRVYLADHNAYVYKLIKEGVHGLPLGANGYALCSVYNGISALSCLTLIMNGFRPRLLLVYDEDEPSSIRLSARFTAYIARYLAEDTLDLSYVSIKSSVIGNGIVVDILNAYLLDALSSLKGERRIVLPFTPSHDMAMVEDVVSRLSSNNNNKIILIPLLFMDYSIIYRYEEISSYCIKDLSIQDCSYDEAKLIKYAKECASNVKSINIKVTENLMHDIIDAIV